MNPLSAQERETARMLGPERLRRLIADRRLDEKRHRAKLVSAQVDRERYEAMLGSLKEGSHEPN